MNEVYYLVKEYRGMKVGTPIVPTEKDSAILQAEALIGTPRVPTLAFRLIGSKEVFVIPSFEDIYSKVHPLDPRNTEPLWWDGTIALDADTLPGGYSAMVTYENQFPRIIIKVVINPEVNLDITNIQYRLPKESRIANATIEEIRKKIEKRLVLKK